MQTIQKISSTMILSQPKAYKTSLDIQERRHLETMDDVCTRCGGAGFYLPDVHWNHEKFGKAQPCDCRNTPELLLKKSGVAAAETDYTFDWYEGLPGRQFPAKAIRDAVSEQEGFVYIHGRYGVGKSGMLKTAAVMACRSGTEAFYSNMADILQTERETFDGGQSRLDYLKQVPILCIDEFFRQSQTDWANELVMSLLDKRYVMRESKLTIVASNTGPEAFTAEWAYLRSRLKDAQVIMLGGDDMRGGE